MSLIVGAAICVICSSLVFAQPRQFSYQAEVRTSSGALTPDGIYTVTIRIYETSIGGTALYSEEHTAPIQGGIMNIHVGSKAALPQTLPFERELFLGVTIDEMPELQPRTRILSVPTAMYAAQAGEALSLSQNVTGIVTSINELNGAIRLIGDSTLTVSRNGNTIHLHSIVGESGGIKQLASPEQTLQIQSPSGPLAQLDVANGAITTQKLANASVTGTKIAQLGATSGQVLKWNGTTWLPANDLGLERVAAIAPIEGDGTAANPLSLLQSSSTSNGYLSSADWTTFNNKLATVAVTPRLTGNGTGASPLDIAQQGATAGQVLKWDGTMWTPGGDLIGLTTISTDLTLAGDGTTGNVLKVAQQGATNGQVLKWNGTTWVPANDLIGLTTVSVTAPITGDGTTGNPLAIPQANATTNGYLSSTDWTTFNSKLTSVAVTSRLTGDGTTANPLDIAQQGATNGQTLKWDGASWSPANDIGLASVSVRSPELTGTGISSDPIVLSQQGATSGQILKWNGTSWSPASDDGLTTVAVNAPITGNGTTASPLSIAQANGSTNGYLSSTDWTTFNNKLSAVTVTPRLSGDGTTANPLDIAQQGATSGQTLKWNGSSWSPANDIGGLAAVATDATLSGDGTTADPLKVAQQGATSGQVLKWNGSTWLPANDNGLATVSVRSPELAGSGTTVDPIYLAQQGATSGQVLKWNGTSWSPAADNGLATVAVNSPITGNGTTGSPISIAQANGSTNGFLSSTDWTTFNNKLSSVAVTPRLTGNGTTANPLDIAQQGATNGQVLQWNGTSWSPGPGGLLDVAANAPITGDGTSADPLSMAQANGSTDGYLSSADWTTFNNKLSAVAVTPRLTGDGTTANPLDIAQQGATNGQVLKWNGTSWSPANDGSAVLTDATLAGDGTTGDVLKIAQQGATNGQVLKWNGTTWVPGAAGMTSIFANAPITGDGTSGNPLTIAQANGSTNGFLSSSDWTTFNNKLSAVAVTPRLTGDGTAADPLDIAQQGATNGQVLKWNGSTWLPANDITGTLANGTTNNSTLRWDGTNWVENVNVLSTAPGQLTVNAGVNFNGVNSPLQLNGSAGNTGYVLASQGTGNTPAWQDPNALLSAWKLSGNTLTGGASSSPTEFFGSMNNYDVIFRTNNQERMRIVSSGNVGIGLTNPTEAKFTASGTILSGGQQRLGSLFSTVFPSGIPDAGVPYNGIESRLFVQNTATVNLVGAAVVGITTLQGTNTNTARGLIGVVDITTSNAATHTLAEGALGRVWTNPFTSGTVTITNGMGLRSDFWLQTNNVTVQNAFGVYVDAPTIPTGISGNVLTNFTGLFFENISVGTGTKRVMHYAGSGSNLPFVLTDQGRVGIGHTTPAQLLDVKGNALLSASSGTAGQLQFQNPAGTSQSTFAAGAQTANISYTLPTFTPPQNGSFMLSSTAGAMSWARDLAWDTTNKRLAINATSPNTKLDINGDVSLRENSITLGNGNNNNITVGDYSFIRITGPTAAFTITGIAGGQNGRVLVLYNDSGQQMTINHLDNTNSNAGNLIRTRNGAAYTTPGASAYDVVTLMYSAAGSQWIITSTY